MGGTEGELSAIPMPKAFEPKAAFGPGAGRPEKMSGKGWKTLEIRQSFSSFSVFFGIRGGSGFPVQGRASQLPRELSGLRLRDAGVEGSAGRQVQGHI